MNVRLPVARLVDEVTAGPAGGDVGAFFDLDGTLVAGFTATVHAGHRIRTRQARIGEVIGVLEASVRYRIGRMQFEPLIVRAGEYLRGESLADLDELGEYLFTRHIERRVFTAMRDVVRAHQDRGHTVALSSSALTIHAGPVARHLGVEHVICNRFEVDDRGLLTGGIARPIVWGRNKATAVERFSRQRGIELSASYFYADGNEDAALMRLVGHPRPVNPRPGLARVAARHDWPVLDVREPGRLRRR